MIRKCKLRIVRRLTILVYSFRYKNIEYSSTMFNVCPVNLNLINRTHSTANIFLHNYVQKQIPNQAQNLRGGGDHYDKLSVKIQKLQTT